MNRDELVGKAEAAKGKIKQTVGKMTGDEELANRGAEEEAEGRARDVIGRGRRKVGEAIEDLGKAVKR